MRPAPAREHVPGGEIMIFQKDQQFNVLPPHMGLRKYIQYYNVVFPEKDTFLPQYTLMPNACGTLSLAFDGFSIRAELWGATTMPIKCQVKVPISDHIIMDTLFTLFHVVLNAIRLTGYCHHGSVVKYPVKDRICYDRIIKDRFPISKVDICGNNGAFLFISHIN